MKSPNPARYNPDPDYLRDLINQIGLPQHEIASALNIHPIQFRFYMVSPKKRSHRPCPYLTQYALECWAYYETLSYATNSW